MSTNFEPQEDVIFVQSTNIGPKKIKPSTVSLFMSVFTTDNEKSK